MGCPAQEDKYRIRDGNCCDRCPAGQYVEAECSGTRRTKCAGCRHGSFTDTTNHLRECRPCSICKANKKERKLMDCTADTDTVCECVTGYYYKTDESDHCYQVTKCPPGTGVKVQATRRNDTVCVPCEEGTFSNVTDFVSPCRAHTRCEDLGREVKYEGNRTTDFICGDFKSTCSSLLPAGLWSGFVLTVLVVLGLVCLRSKRRSYTSVITENPSNPVSVVEVPPPCCLQELPLKVVEVNGDCKLPAFNQDDYEVCYSSQHSADSGLQPKTSLSSSECSQTNGNAGKSLPRSYSEPQEDEWWGT